MSKITYLCFVILFCLSLNISSQSGEIQRVRVDFVSPLGYARHLLLAFTPDNAASDGFDYGYDALLFDEFPDELNWMIDNKRYVIQGVGSFENSKFYPFGMFLTNSGEIKIRLTALENFDTPINVFIYDSEQDLYTSINNSDYVKSVTKGEYLDRFFITFTNNSELINIPGSVNALSISENEIKEPSLNYVKSTRELQIKTNTAVNLKQVSLYNILGKQLINIENINSNTIRIPLSSLNTNGSLIVSLTAEDGKKLNKHILVSQ
jgi:hypothetical protein